MNKPHCIELLQTKAWTTESADGKIRWTRSFGAPDRLRSATHVSLLVCGAKLPNNVQLNGARLESQLLELHRMKIAMDRKLLERNKVELVWESEMASEVNADGFSSLSSIYLEIFE